MTVVESDITYDMVIKEYGNGWNPVPFNTREGKAVLEEYVPYREARQQGSKLKNGCQNSKSME